MRKSFSYRLFGIGKIPADLAAMVQSEGVLVMDEGIRGSTTYLDFRAPGRYSNWRRQWQTAAIVLTEHRLLALMNSQPVINVQLDDERIRKLQFAIEDNECLFVSVDPSLFHEDWTGTIEYRFHLAQAQELMSLLRERVRGELRVV